MKIVLASILTVAAAVPQPSQQCIDASTQKAQAMAGDQQFATVIKSFEDHYNSCAPKIEACVTQALANGGNPSQDCITTTLTCLQTALDMWNTVNHDICQGTYGGINLEELQMCTAQGKPKVPGLNPQNPSELTEVPLEIKLKACGPVECNVDELIGGALDFVPDEILAMASGFTWGCQTMQITTTPLPTTTTSKCDGETAKLMSDGMNHPEASVDFAKIQTDIDACAVAGQKCVENATAKGDMAAAQDCGLTVIECGFEASSVPMKKLCGGQYDGLITASEFQLCAGEVEHDHASRHDIEVFVCMHKECNTDTLAIPNLEIKWSCVDADLVMGAPNQSKLPLAAFAVLALLSYFSL